MRKRKQNATPDSILETFEAASAGEAFAYCLIDHPGSQLLTSYCQGRFQTSEGFTEFQPPPVQREPVKQPRPFRKPKKNEKVGEFPFYNEVKSKPVPKA